MRKEAQRWLRQSEADLRAAQDNLTAFSKLQEAARSLDAFYIPTRYPNGIDEDLAPVDYYDKEDGEKCLNFATSILDVVRTYLKS